MKGFFVLEQHRSQKLGIKKVPNFVKKMRKTEIYSLKKPETSNFNQKIVFGSQAKYINWENISNPSLIGRLEN